MNTDKNTGHGRVKPLDTDEFAEVSVYIKNSFIDSACFLCSDDPYLRNCLITLTEVLKDKPATDVFQINNNCIYYNMSDPLPRHKLYTASMAVLAAKRAVADWCRKNGIAVPDGHCACSTDTDTHDN